MSKAIVLEETNKSEKKTVGLVMPIAGIDDCPDTHWSEIKHIITDVVEKLGHDCKLVSDETDVGVIQKRIVHNLYNSDLVICDVSCRNPNVMFELGMRLAFDKPVILIKDEKTPYSFDTSPVEHLSYRRDLRFNSVVEFKSKLGSKIESVLSSEGKFSFLASFGPIKSAKLSEEKAEPYEMIMDEVRAINARLNNMSSGVIRGFSNRVGSRFGVTAVRAVANINLIEVDYIGDDEFSNRLLDIVSKMDGFSSISVSTRSTGRTMKLTCDEGGHIKNISDDLRFELEMQRMLRKE